MQALPLGGAGRAAGGWGPAALNLTSAAGRRQGHNLPGSGSDAPASHGGERPRSGWIL